MILLMESYLKIKVHTKRCCNMKFFKLIVGLAIAGVALYALDALMIPLSHAFNMPFIRYFTYAMNVIAVVCVFDKCMKDDGGGEEKKKVSSDVLR